MTAPTHRDRTWLARVWYRSLWVITRLGFELAGGFRASGLENVPETGGALIASNHLSYLDVFVLGIASPRPLNYVARASLFRPPLSWLIRSVGGFPIDREGSGTAGLKETLRRLRGGSVVLIFPEGTRSFDGALGPLKPGFAALARAGAPIVPAAIAGTFEAWPRGRRFPRPHPTRVHFGPPIRPEELAGISAQELTERLQARLLACQQAAREALPAARRGRGTS